MFIVLGADLVLKIPYQVTSYGVISFFNVGASIELNNILIPSMIKNNINGKIIHISSYSAIDGGPDVKKFGGSTLMHVLNFFKYVY